MQKEANPTPSNYSCKYFDGFVKFAISFIKNNNHELAKFISDYLKTHKKEYQFRFFPNLQNFPRKAFDKNNTIIFSNDEYSMEIDARREIDSFTQENNFDQESDAVIFNTEGNWSYLIEFAKKYPQADMVIVEDHPELLAEMITFSLFLHHLPEKTLIIGQNKKLKGYKNYMTQNWQNGKRLKKE